MNNIGFSTGAIAKGDFRRALEILRRYEFTAVELSALRLPELPALMSSLRELDVRRYEYVSVHAPSSWEKSDEREVIKLLEEAVASGFSIVVHPDTIHDWSAWVELGDAVLIENMDRRKRIGRTVSELGEIFRRLPKARMCLDVAHVKQVDPSLVEGYAMLREFRDRIAQIHISDLWSDGRHGRVTLCARLAYEQLVQYMNDWPIIIESPVEESEIRQEAQVIGALFAQRERCIDEKSSPTIRLGAPEAWGEYLANTLRRNGCRVSLFADSNWVSLSEESVKDLSVWAFSREFCERESQFVNDMQARSSHESLVFCLNLSTSLIHPTACYDTIHRTADTLLDVVRKRGRYPRIPGTPQKELEELFIPPK